ncbi:MAG TPA: PQQ-binding-like beta-propeller repeat protein, partial [Verrucomicrobiae bacterium]|nr:PQQ-binding-like beta-propeller repeat protein [Verrucomicrobiae bacterium]
MQQLPSEPRVLWRIKSGDGLASPVVASGRVFHLDNQNGKETLHAFNAANGQSLWSHTLDDAFKDSQSTAGPRCTPLVDGDRVYAQSCRGELRCLDAKDGNLLWRVHYVTNFRAVFIGERGQAAGAARHGYNGQPVIDGPHLISIAGGTNGATGASIVCLDKQTGTVVWQSQHDTAAYAPPIVADLGGRRQVIAFTVESLLAVDRLDGRLLWHVPLKTTFGRHVTTPVVVDGMVMVSSHEFGLIGVRVTADAGVLRASVSWTNKAAAINFASPVAIGSHLYGVGPSKDLVCIETTTGKTAWTREGFFTSSASKAHAGLVVMGSNLLVLTDAGELVLVAG